MKLRYQMRGLGIGMIVTALLMGVTGNEKLPLSDAEIRAKAIELGMVDSDSRKLTDVGNQTYEPTSAPPVSGADMSSEQGEAEPEGETTEPDSTAGEGEADDSETAESVEPESEQTSEAQDMSGGGVADTESLTEAAVQIVIESGTTSYSVSRMLAEAGLVADAVEFDNYLCSNGYSTSITAGTYEIWPGTDEEEIIKMITKKR